MQIRNRLRKGLSSCLTFCISADLGWSRPYLYIIFSKTLCLPKATNQFYLGDIFYFFESFFMSLLSLFSFLYINTRNFVNMFVHNSNTMLWLLKTIEQFCEKKKQIKVFKSYGAPAIRFVTWLCWYQLVETFPWMLCYQNINGPAWSNQNVCADLA